MRQYICESQFTYHFIPPGIAVGAVVVGAFQDFPLTPCLTDQWAVVSQKEAIQLKQYKKNNTTYIVFNYMNECSQYTRLYFPILELKTRLCLKHNLLLDLDYDNLIFHIDHYELFDKVDTKTWL